MGNNEFNEAPASAQKPNKDVELTDSANEPMKIAETVPAIDDEANEPIFTAERLAEPVATVNLSETAAKVLPKDITIEDKSAGDNTIVLAQAGPTEVKQEEDRLDLATVMKTDYMGGLPEKFKGLDQNANDEQIETFAKANFGEKEASAKDLKDHKFEKGSVVVFRDGDKVQVAFVDVADDGSKQFVKQEGTELKRFDSLKDAFGAKDDSTIRVYSGEKAAVAAKPTEIATVNDKVEPAKSKFDDATRAYKTLMAERFELHSKKADEKITVPGKDGQNREITVAERRRELDREIIEMQTGSDRVVFGDKSDLAIKEASDRLRGHDYFIAAAGAEIGEYQATAKKPTDKVTVIKLVDGKPQEVEMTVADRVRELKTAINKEVDQSLKTADQVSPYADGNMIVGGAITEVRISDEDLISTRMLDVKAHDAVKERTVLARRLGIFDNRLLTIKNLKTMQPRDEQERADIESLKRVINKIDRIQDVRHGRAYTLLRASEMNASGFSNPNLGVEAISGTDNDVIKAQRQFNQAHLIDSSLRSSQDVTFRDRIYLADKVIPMLRGGPQELKLFKAAAEMQRSGMTLEEFTNKISKESGAAEEVVHLVTLGGVDITNSRKSEQVFKLDRQRATNVEFDRYKNDEKYVGPIGREAALRKAVEESKKIDVAWLRAEANKEFNQMFYTDGTRVDPKKLRTDVPTIAGQATLIADQSATAKLELATLLYDNGKTSYTSLIDLQKTHGVDKTLDQVLKDGSEEEQAAMKEVVKRLYNDDPDKYKGVTIRDAMQLSKDKFDEASVLFLESKADALHLVYKRTDDGEFVAKNETLRKMDIELTAGAITVNPQSWAESNEKLSIIQKGGKLDKHGNKINARDELEKMYQVTELVRKDLERQNESLQKRIDDLKEERKGLKNGEFTSEDARRLEEERLDRKIKFLESTIKQRTQSIDRQKNLTKYLDAGYSVSQENFQRARDLLDEVKRDDLELYNNKDINMKELHDISRDWWKRNWRGVAYGIAMTAAVGVGVITAGFGAPASVAIAAGATTMLASGALAMNMEKYATGDLDADNFWDRYNSGETSWRTGFEGAAAGFNFFGVGYASKLLHLRKVSQISKLGSAAIKGNMWRTIGTYSGIGFGAQLPHMGIDAYDMYKGDMSWQQAAMQTGGRTMSNAFGTWFIGRVPVSRYNPGGEKLGMLSRGFSKATSIPMNAGPWHSAGRAIIAGEAFTVGEDVGAGLMFEGWNKYQRWKGKPAGPKYDMLTGTFSGLEQNNYRGHFRFGAIRSELAKYYKFKYGGDQLNLQRYTDRARFAQNFLDAGLLGPSTHINLTTDGTTFMTKPFGSRERNIYASGLHPGPIKYIEPQLPFNLKVHDPSKPEPSKLAVTVQGLKAASRPDNAHFWELNQDPTLRIKKDK